MSCWSSSIFTFPGTWEVFFSIPNFPLLYLDTAATMTLNCLSKDLSLYENLTVFSFSSQDSLYPQSVQLLSCVWLCDPMNRSTPGLPVHHQLPEFTQTHVHRVGDAIQPSHPVVPFSFCPQSLPASGSFPMSQLFTWGGQSIGVSASVSVLPMNIQDWSPLGLTGWISLQSKGLSRVFSNTTVQKHQFFSAQLSSQSNSHIYTWPLEKP